MKEGKGGIMEEMDHPFIIKLFKTYQDDIFMSCVPDLLQGGELFSVMRPDNKGEIQKVPESQAKFYVLAIADALAYMHSSQYCSQGPQSRECFGWCETVSYS
jgi:serine/threonine protein kinase